MRYIGFDMGDGESAVAAFEHGSLIEPVILPVCGSASLLSAVGLLGGEIVVGDRALTDALHAKTSWARSTTLTLLRRLTEKGAVRTEVRDGMHVYFPAVSREDAAARQTRDLLGRVYHGSLSLLVSAMTREEALSKAEIDELYAILDEMEAKQGDA